MKHKKRAVATKWTYYMPTIVRAHWLAAERALFSLKCISKGPERWSCWYTLDQYSDLIGFTNAMKNIEQKPTQRRMFFTKVCEETF